MKTLHLKGQVFSGKGEGAKYIKLPWAKKQIQEKLGFTPYLGTLNVRLTEDSAKLKETLTRAKSMEILPQPGFCPGKLFKASLTGDIKCAVVIPKVPDYPTDLLEIIAPINLRQKCHLKDSDAVEVKITF